MMAIVPNNTQPPAQTGPAGIPTLSVRGLSVEFPTRHGTLVATRDISFDIQPGEILGMVGESGAGKSLTGMNLAAAQGAPASARQGNRRHLSRPAD
jgi:ABC-type glutathione transport system ATPase component